MNRKAQFQNLHQYWKKFPECNSGRNCKCHYSARKNVTATSKNTSTIVSPNISRQMPLLSDVFVIFLSPIAVLTPNGQFLDCVAIAFRERNFHIDASFRPRTIVIAACSVVMSGSYLQISPVCHSTDNGACEVSDGRQIICRVLLRRYFGSEWCIVELDC